MNHTLIISEVHKIDGRFVAGDYEISFPTRSLMLVTLGKLVRRQIEVKVKQ